MIELAFKVLGEPRAQPRHRAIHRGGRTWMYLPTTALVKSWKDEIKLSIFTDKQIADLTKEGILPWRTQPICIRLKFLWHYPKSWPKKRKIQWMVPRTGKPDTDNLIKAVKDAITDSKKIWHDDAQVYLVRSVKYYYSGKSCLEIEIEAHE